MPSIFSRDSLPEPHRAALPPIYVPRAGKAWPVITPVGDQVEVAVDADASGFPVTPFHLATNLPLFMPKADQISHVLPKLAAAGIVVWRWPGGAIGDGVSCRGVELRCPSATKTDDH